MRSSAPTANKPEAELIGLTRFSLSICPYSFTERDLNAKVGEKLQKELIEYLNKCGLRAGANFTIAQPNSIEMIRYEGKKSLLSNYAIVFNSTGEVLNALKVLPAHLTLHCQNQINFQELRTLYALQHSDNETIMPADLAEVIELHQRSYRELYAKIQVAIQTNAGNMHPSLVNFQAAMKYIDENTKENPYLVEDSRYSLLMLALWYVVQDLKDIEPEAKKGFKSLFQKVSANMTPVNAKYNELFNEYVKRIPAKFNDPSVSTPESLKALYNEKIGKHITPALAPTKK